MTYRFLLVSALTCMSFATSADVSNERAHLALIQQQLEAIKVALARAESESKSNLNNRYIFNYNKLKSDLHTIENGIAAFLNPKRAQPRNLNKLAGDYEEENRDD